MHNLEGLAGWAEQLVLVGISLIANAFSSFSGGGAGLVQLPMLIFLGLPFALALATHKIATVALGLGASLRHWREHTLEREFVLLMLVCGLPGVLVGAFSIVRIPDRVATVALGVLTIGLGVYSVFKPKLGQHYEPRHRDTRGLMLGGLGMLVIGVLNGSLTSGTGLFVTLWLVGWFGMDYLRAVAHTLVMVGLFWNGTGAITLALISEVYWPWLPALIAGSLLGGYLGAHLAISKGNRWIKRGFEVVTILIGLKLLVG